MRFKITIDVKYDQAGIVLSPEDVQICLERELARHIEDGLLLFDFTVDEYHTDIEYIAPID